MISPTLLVVFVMSSARMERTAAPFQQAAREVLGPSAELRVEAAPGELPDAAAIERAGGADGVVELIWNGARQTAVLHCYIASEQRWIDRTIRFARADADWERGRQLGFVAASMFADVPGIARASAVEPRQVAKPAHARPAPLGAPPKTSAASSGTGIADAPPAPAPRSGQSVGTYWLEFAGVATSGLGASSAAEVGARAAFGLPLSERIAVRIQFAGRAGEVPVAQANVRRLIAGGGVAWNALPEASDLALWLRADALGSWIQVSHLSSDDVASVKNHGWLFGGAAMATLGYRISTSLTLHASCGIEAMLGQTHVFTHGVEVATLPGVRGVGELGFLTHF